MPVSLLDDLEAYAAADTKGWAAYSKHLSEEVGCWAAERLESTLAAAVIRPEFVDPTYVRDELLSHLLAPETANKYLNLGLEIGGNIRSNMEARIRADLAEDVLTFLVATFVSGEDSDRQRDRDAQGPFLGSDGRSLEVPWFGEAIFGQVELCEFIDRAAMGPAAQAPLVAQPDPSGIVCLETIDPALYRALIGHPELLRSLDWRVFEQLLADLLERSGYEVELQRGTKDGGVDVFAIKRNGMFGPERYLLQAKRWHHSVGVEPVRQLAFLHSDHRMTKSCLATTSRFTKGAWQLAAQYQWQLELRDYDGIRNWLALVSNKLVI